MAEEACGAGVEECTGEEEEDGEEGLEPGAGVVAWLGGGAEGENDCIPCSRPCQLSARCERDIEGRGFLRRGNIPVCMVANTPQALNTALSTSPEVKQQKRMGMDVM